MPKKALDIYTLPWFMEMRDGKIYIPEEKRNHAIEDYEKYNEFDQCYFDIAKLEDKATAEVSIADILNNADLLYGDQDFRYNSKKYISKEEALIKMGRLLAQGRYASGGGEFQFQVFYIDRDKKQCLSLCSLAGSGQRPDFDWLFPFRQPEGLPLGDDYFRADHAMIRLLATRVRCFFTDMALDYAINLRDFYATLKQYDLFLNKITRQLSVKNNYFQSPSPPPTPRELTEEIGKFDSTMALDSAEYFALTDECEPHTFIHIPLTHQEILHHYRFLYQIEQFNLAIATTIEVIQFRKRTTEGVASFFVTKNEITSIFAQLISEISSDYHYLNGGNLSKLTQMRLKATSKKEDDEILKEQNALLETYENNMKDLQQSRNMEEILKQQDQSELNAYQDQIKEIQNTLTKLLDDMSEKEKSWDVAEENSPKERLANFNKQLTVLQQKFKSKAGNKPVFFLSLEQCITTLENRMDQTWIWERLEKHQETIKQCLTELEDDGYIQKMAAYPETLEYTRDLLNECTKNIQLFRMTIACVYARHIQEINKSIQELQRLIETSVNTQEIKEDESLQTYNNHVGKLLKQIINGNPFSSSTQKLLDTAISIVAQLSSLTKFDVAAYFNQGPHLPLPVIDNIKSTVEEHMQKICADFASRQQVLDRTTNYSEQITCLINLLGQYFNNVKNSLYTPAIDFLTNQSSTPNVQYRL